MRRCCLNERKRVRFGTRSIGLLAASLLLAVLVPAGQAQLPQTRIYSVFPPGGKAGSSVDIQVTSGADLDELSELRFSHPGIKAVPKLDANKQPVANTFTVTIDGSVPAGLHEVRARGLFGGSNPRTFVVDTRGELIEEESNNTPDQAKDIPLNVIVNGRSNAATDVDYYKFPGKKGQRIIATCRAARIDSKMIAALEIIDAQGRRLGYGRDQLRHDPVTDVTLPADGEYFVKIYDHIYRGGNEYIYRLLVHTGPHVDYIMPPAGMPWTTLKYTIYGRNIPGGQPAGVSIDGRPLEKLTVKIELPKDLTKLQSIDHLSPVEAGIDGISYVVNGPGGASNPTIIQFADSPVVLEQEPNDEPAKSQKIAVPGEVAGQFQSRGDIDFFSFDAKAGQVFYIEVFGQRNGSTADPYLTLDQVTVNDKGEESVKRITAQDDNATNLAGLAFDTRSDDPVYRFQVPADSAYRLSVRDRYFESRGDPRLVYRLCIRTEKPDFRLVVVPIGPPPAKNQPANTWAMGLRKGDNFHARVLAFRRDGFNGPIDVTADSLPDGVQCKGTIISGGQSSAPMIFTATENAPEWFGAIRVVGRAQIDDSAKVRAVAAAQGPLKSATAAVTKSEAPARKAEDDLKKAREQLAAAKNASTKKPDDKGLKDKLTAAENAVKAAEAAAGKANATFAAAQKQLADAEAALNKARGEQALAVRQISREARSATVAWPGAAATASISRTSRSLWLSVLKESAPFQVTTDVFRVEVNQGRQILVPVKLLKRTGFDADVALSFVGLPNGTNIQIQNKPIKKGKTEELLRLFAANNAKVGTYTLYLKADGQVSYSRNPQRVTRAKAEQAEFVKQLAASTGASKKTAATRDAAVKQATTAVAALKKSTDAKTATEKQAKTTADATKKATDEKTAADKAATDAATAAKTAADKAAEAKKAADADTENQDLATQAATAEKAAVAATEVAKKAEAVKAAAGKKLAEAQAAAKKATDAVAVAEKTRAAADAAGKAANDAKTKAEAAAKTAADKAKADDTAKKAADKRVADAQKAAKPKNIKIAPPSTPMIITVKRGAATMTAAVPSGGNLKRGAKLDVKVTVKRINGFAGPITISLPLPPGVTDVSAPPVTIPADQTQGVLSIQAGANATEGALANLVIRGTMTFEGKAAVDAPITVKVAK